MHCRSGQANAEGTQHGALVLADVGKDQERDPSWKALLEQFNPGKHVGVPLQNLLKRAHSKAWHEEHNRFKDALSDEGSKEMAKAAAKRATTEFLRAYGP